MRSEGGDCWDDTTDDVGELGVPVIVVLLVSEMRRIVKE